MSHNYNGYHMYCTTTPPIHPIARQVNVTTALSKLNLTNTSAYRSLSYLEFTIYIDQYFGYDFLFLLMKFFKNTINMYVNY